MPTARIFLSVEEAQQAVDKLKMQGIQKEQIYALALEAEKATAKELRVSDTEADVKSPVEFVKQFFRNGASDIYERLTKLGYSDKEARDLSEQLKEHNILIAVDEDPEKFSFDK
ncbi:general stress protein [Marinococcus luteus]|uniref:general stress protein n=1 Tax=Marinococcus luteus TaxID=1122204 RepID=UPI002ACCB096|nr:general stress protein [Marinococcus luteus]MDZ5784312.1 general stress protein [Marinococcus luteus]